MPSHKKLHRSPSKSPKRKTSPKKTKSKRKTCTRMPADKKAGNIWLMFLDDVYCELQKHRPKGAKGLYKEAMQIAKSPYNHHIRDKVQPSEYKSRRADFLERLIVPACSK